MNDEELKRLWCKQKLDPAKLSPDEQIKLMRRKLNALDRVSRWVEAMIISVAAGLIVVFVLFGWYFLKIPILARFGLAIMITGSLVFDIGKRIRARRRSLRPLPDAPVTQWLRHELKRLRAECELSRTGLLGDNLTFWIGAMVFCWGLDIDLSSQIFFSAVLTGMTVILHVTSWKLKLYTRRKADLPLIEELESLLRAGEFAAQPEEPSMNPAPTAAPSAQKRNGLAAAGIVLVVLVAGLIVVWNSPRNELPRAPGFDDVSTFSEDDLARVDAWLREQVALAQYPSLSAAVVRDGRIVYQRAFGFEDIKARRKATPETSYHVASVTKAFTASIAVMLHARGVIDLDQPVVKYLPKDVSISTKPKLGATITLRQLASHTSGLPRGVPGPVQSVEGRYELEPKLLYDQLAGVTLEFAPGTGELYSNLGFGLLGHVLERAAGKPFDQLLQELVCDPLHLERTAIQDNAQLRLATGYSSSKPRREAKESYRERFASSGGLIASAPDLAQFLSAQMKPGIFTSELLAQLHTPSRLSDGSLAHTALGWTLRSSDTVGRILEKNGGRDNCAAWIGFAPDHGIGVAVVANCGEPDVDAIGRWLLERSVPGGHKPVTKYGYAKVAPYTGVRWENGRPIVRVQDRWSPLVSIDGIPIDRIMEFAQREFGEKTRMRLAEDLVEVLSKMGHDPGWTVTLGLEKRDGQVEHLQIRMTKENRDLVKK